MSWKWSRGLGFGRALLVCALSVIAPAWAGATGLRVELQAADGRIPDVKSAVLLVAGWGWTDRLPLEFAAQGRLVVLTIPLDERFYTQWPTVTNTNMGSVYLFVEGRNFVSFLAGTIVPDDRAGGGVVRTIDFPRGPDVQITRGETSTVRFTVRTTPQTRTVRFVDDAGRPVRGVSVSAYVGWEAPSHCLSYSPSEPPPLMVGRRSDGRGVVRLPDGDFPYVLSIGVHQHQQVADRDFDDSDRALKAAITGERVVRVHNRPRRPLSIRVFIGEQPVREFSLHAPVEIPGCGASGGEQVFTPKNMRAGAAGEMIVSDFYPDEVPAICIGDSSGHVVWRTTQFDQLLIVRLPAGTALGDPDLYECASGRRSSGR